MSTEQLPFQSSLLNPAVVATNNGTLSLYRYYRTEPLCIHQASLYSSYATPGQYGLHRIYMHFIQYAEEKLEQISALPTDKIMPLEDILYPGIDQEWDRTLQVLVDIGQYCPQMVITALMQWIEKKHKPDEPQPIKKKWELKITSTSKEQINFIQERKMYAADYIFAYTVIQIIERLQTNDIQEPLALKLENYAFEHIKTHKSDVEMALKVTRHPNYLQYMYSQLIGALSGVKFMVITEKFISVLEHHTSKESAIEAIIRIMPYIKLEIYPMEAFEETINFLKACTESFQESSIKLKQALAEVFCQWFLAIAAVTEAEVNVPAWMKNIEILYAKAIKMMSKPKNYSIVYPLICSLLCVSRADFFLKNWQTYLESCWRLFKDKNMRLLGLVCATRTIWVYLFRCETSQSNCVKVIEMLGKVCFPYGRRYVNPLDTPLELFVQMVYFAGVKQFDFTMKNIVLNLLLTDGNLYTMDSIHSERTIIAFRAFLKMTDDIVNCRLKSEFPIFNTKQWMPPSDLSFSDVPNSIIPMDLAKRYGINTYAERMNGILSEVIRIIHGGIGNYSSKTEKYVNKSMQDAIPKEKHIYLDVMKCAFSCIPRIFPTRLLAQDFAELLCTYTIHLDKSLMEIASHTMRRIMAQCPNLRVILLVSFINFIKTIPYRHFNLLTDTLSLMQDLMTIWLDQLIEMKDVSDISDSKEIQRIIHLAEGKIMILLCSASAGVRSNCLKIIHSLGELAKILLKNEEANNSTKKFCSIIDIINQYGSEIVKKTYIESISLMPSRKNEQFIPKGISFFKLAEYDSGIERALWAQCFADMLQVLYEKCTDSLAPCWFDICYLLSDIQQLVESVVHSEGSSTLSFAPFSLRQENLSDDIIFQWRSYLSFACCIAIPDYAGDGKPTPAKLKMSSARALFRSVLPILRSDSAAVRVSIVTALGRVNANVFKILLEEMQSFFQTIADDVKPKNQKNRRKHDRMRMDLCQIHFLNAKKYGNDSVLNDESLIRIVLDYIMDTKSYLAQNSSQPVWELHMLFFYLCRFIQIFYEIIVAKDQWAKYFPPEIRASLFYFFDEWCGFGDESGIKKKLENKVFFSMLSKNEETDKGMTQNFEEQYKAFETATLMAMCELLKGSVFSKDRKKNNRAIFEVDGLFSWIEMIFSAPDENLHKHGCQAVQWLLQYNKDRPELLDIVIERCYSTCQLPKLSNGYFTALVNVFSIEAYVCKPHKILTLALFKMADGTYSTRQSSVLFLQTVERYYFVESTITDHEVALSGCFPQTYVHLRAGIYSRLAKTRHELAYAVFSECTQHFDLLGTVHQRHMLNVLFPWVPFVDLLVSKENELEEHSLIFLTNLLYLTIKYDSSFPEKIEALWARLVEKTLNVKIVIYFLMRVAMRTKNPMVFGHAKKITTYMGRGRPRMEVLSILINEMLPESVLPLSEDTVRLSPMDSMFYVAPLDNLIETLSHAPAYSVGELSFIFLIDLALEVGDELWSHLPVLLHMSFVHMDHMNIIVCEHARSILTNFVHSIVLKQSISPNNDNATVLIADLLKKEGIRLWKNEDMQYSNNAVKTPEELQEYLYQVIELFGEGNDLIQKWGELALRWGINCPVRHIACRSLQIFSAIMPVFNQSMVLDLLMRISDTAADLNEDVRAFTLEEIATLHAMVQSLEPDQLRLYPEIFWSAVALLLSNHEYEFLYALELVQEILKKINLWDPQTEEIFVQSLPADWEPLFEGIHPLILKGLTSKVADTLSLRFLDELLLIDCEKILGPSRRRLLFSMVALIPFLALYSKVGEDQESNRIAIHLASECERIIPKSSFPRIFNNYIKKRFRADEDFLKQLASAIDSEFSPEYDAELILFIMELLRNGPDMFKKPILNLLQEILYCMRTTVSETEPERFAILCTELVDPITALLWTEKHDSYLMAAAEIMKNVGDFDISKVPIHSGNQRQFKSLGKTDQTSIWTSDELNTAYLRNNIEKIISTCLGEVISKKPSVVFSTYESVEAAKSENLPHFVPTISSIPETSDLFLHVGEPYGQLITSLNALERLSANNDSMMSEKIDLHEVYNRAMNVQNESFFMELNQKTMPLPRNRPRKITDGMHTISHTLLEKFSPSHDLAFGNACRRTISVPLSSNSRMANTMTNIKALKILVTLQLSLMYNEVISIENFISKFETELANNLCIDVTQISVILIEDDPLKENGPALVTIEFTRPVKDSSFDLMQLAENIHKQLNHENSTIYMGKSTGKIMRSFKPKIMIETLTGRLPFYTLIKNPASQKAQNLLTVRHHPNHELPAEIQTKIGLPKMKDGVGSVSMSRGSRHHSIYSGNIRELLAWNDLYMQLRNNPSEAYKIPITAATLSDALFKDFIQFIGDHLNRVTAIEHRMQESLDSILLKLQTINEWIRFPCGVAMDDTELCKLEYLLRQQHSRHHGSFDHFLKAEIERSNFFQAKLQEYLSRRKQTIEKELILFGGDGPMKDYEAHHRLIKLFEQMLHHFILLIGECIFLRKLFENFVEYPLDQTQQDLSHCSAMLSTTEKTSHTSSPSHSLSKIQ